MRPWGLSLDGGRGKQAAPELIQLSQREIWVDLTNLYHLMTM